MSLAKGCEVPALHYLMAMNGKNGRCLQAERGFAVRQEFIEGSLAFGCCRDADFNARHYNRLVIRRGDRLAERDRGLGVPLSLSNGLQECLGLASC